MKRYQTRSERDTIFFIKFWSLWLIGTGLGVFLGLLSVYLIN